ncbi:MAG: VWA domain-containing protein [Planctomycetota bacterium]
MFARPWVLLTLVVPLMLVAFAWRRDGRRVALPFDHARRGAGRLVRGLLRAGDALPSLLLAVAILLLAGPQELAAPRAKRALTNIEFCVDVSGSMGASFGSGTRYDASMAALNRFLEYRRGDAFGLTFFGNSVLHWVPLTNDVSAFRCAAPFMRPGNLPIWFGGTEIAKALLACRDVLVSRNDGERMIVLITDGVSGDIMGGRDQDLVRKLRSDAIVVYAINVQESVAPGEVVNIARGTGGEVFDANDPHALEVVFQRIDAMQKVKFEKGNAEYVDAFAPLCLAGLAILLLHLLFQFGLRHTPW